ncbi:hypothetical protein [Bacillus sp. AFS040349]|uniref:hypothetical protein n=1 Tax=Bacillus sp. AFS040349 TaxID=2033502 RepID=UPI000BFC2D44|nr:hypothetical protein [Bacillus sp. AFS040349]PGT81576.1 hypothetical protein COD11_17295 [Bacillus sp. AFS040349]
MMGLFNSKKVSEMEKLQEQQAKLQAESGKLQAKLTQIQNGLVIAETNEMIDPTASNKKQVEKFKNAVEKTKEEIAEVTKQAQEVAQQIGAIKAEEKRAEIAEAGKVHEERVYLSHKRQLLENEIDRLNNWLYAKTGNPVEAPELKKLAGLKYNESISPVEHAPYKEAELKAVEAGREKAKRDFEKLMKQINDFLEKNE